MPKHFHPLRDSPQTHSTRIGSNLFPSGEFLRSSQAHLSLLRSAEAPLRKKSLLPLAKAVCGQSFRWIIWGLAATFYLYEYFLRVFPSRLIPEMRSVFSINAEEGGALLFATAIIDFFVSNDLSEMHKMGLVQ